METERERAMTTADLARASGQTSESPQSGPPPDASRPPLLPENEITDLRARWNEIQTGFVDEPRKAVQDADALVAAAMQRLAEIFASERSQLEGQWDRGDDVSTEDLRIALQRYRSFFGRILSI
jgi:hypothetical protein